ncbi:MAG: U4/U6-U5 snRNP complex subunit lsm8, partial [Paramarteilia canceri]
GILHSFDQTLNLTLEQAVERIYSLQHSVEQVPLDVMVIRGENVCLVGELNEHLDSAIDFSKMYVEPIKECKV